MTNESIFIIAAMSINLSLPPADAGGGMPGTITVADSVKETLAKKTLQRAQASAAAAAGEADQLRRVSNSMCSPDWHVEKLTALKGEVNRMSREMSNLRAQRDSLSPWEQHALDEVLPLLQATAVNTESAIEYFNENRDHLWMETYRDYTDRVWKDSDQMARILRNYLKSDRLLDQEVYVAERRRADSQRNDAVTHRNRFIPTKEVHFQPRENSKSVIVEIDDRGCRVGDFGRFGIRATWRAGIVHGPILAATIARCAARI
ncbi:MAG: hypothetical protein ACLQVG_06175 [Terriglobia bacterium]